MSGVFFKAFIATWKSFACPEILNSSLSTLQHHFFNFINRFGLIVNTEHLGIIGTPNLHFVSFFLRCMLYEYQQTAEYYLFNSAIDTESTLANLTIDTNLFLSV